MLSPTPALRIRKASWSIACSDRTRLCAIARRTKNSLQTAYPYIKRQPLAHFTSRRNPTRKGFSELAIFQRDNSILNLSTARTAHPGFRHDKQSEGPDLHMQPELHMVSVMPLNPTKRSPAVHMQRIGRSLIKVKVKSRSTGRMRLSRSSRCASC